MTDEKSNDKAQKLSEDIINDALAKNGNNLKAVVDKMIKNIEAIKEKNASFKNNNDAVKFLYIKILYNLFDRAFSVNDTELADYILSIYQAAGKDYLSAMSTDPMAAILQEMKAAVMAQQKESLEAVESNGSTAQENAEEIISEVNKEAAASVKDVLKEKTSELLDKNEDLTQVISELSKYYYHLKKASEKTKELVKYLSSPDESIEEKMQKYALEAGSKTMRDEEKEFF